MSEEREDEEKRLGELDEEHAYERGEAWNVRQGGDRIIDLRRKPYGKKGAIGTVTQQTNVTSTFDTRPISAIDFVHTTIASDFMVGDANTVRANPVAEYTVPEDRVAVIRGYAFMMHPFLSGLGGAGGFLPSSDSIIHMSVRINSTSVPGYTGINYDSVVARYAPCHIICPPGSVVQFSFQITVPTGVFVNTDPVNITFEMYGNLLKSRALPPEFEVGNLRPSKKKVQLMPEKE